MWKRNTLLFAFVAVVHTCVSQNWLASTNNMMRSGDVLTGQQLISIIPGDDGENVEWDFSNIETLNKKQTTIYRCSPDSIFYEIESQSMNKYRLHMDSLLLINYQNPITTINYDIPILVVKYPLHYGDSYTSIYKGKGIYSGKNALDVNGTINVEADGFGSITLPKGESINNVLRVHSVMTSSVGMEKDTIIRDTADRVLEIIEYYKWYAKGSRYPVFGMQTISYFHNADYIKSEQTAYRYPIYSLSLQDDYIEQDDTTFADSSADKDSIISYNIQNENNVITIHYSLTKKAKILALVAGVMGEVYRKEQQTNGAGDNYILTLDCSGLRKGEYILYLNVNGRAYSHKVSIR